LTFKPQAKNKTKGLFQWEAGQKNEGEKLLSQTTERKQRLDQWLVELNHAPTRTKAQELITMGRVKLSNEVVRSAGKKFSEKDLLELQVSPQDYLIYVSRAALKLKSAIERLEVPLVGKRVLDLGCSTGGFSDYCLQKGAAQVVGIEVGRGQLHKRLQSYALEHPQRFKCFEGLDARDVKGNKDLILDYPPPFDLLLADLSFVSLTRVLPDVVDLVEEGGAVLALVKPQFELQAQSLNKKGIVKDPRDYEKVKVKLVECFFNMSLKVQDFFKSELKGRDGNQEFFIYAKKKN
jgi:23S rRNA (cytidine1920-2'-O)/16S rRNA (cytidine1409-2'-O)-methyltransferase